MIFLFGPLYGGKHDFACRLLGCTPEELKSRAVDHVENHAAQARDLEALADELAKAEVVIATEVGGGVVPADPQERSAGKQQAGSTVCWRKERILWSGSFTDCRLF